MDMGKWKGLFEWSMQHQDGSNSNGGNVKELDPAKKEWLDKALSEFMKDFADRMKEIKDALSADGEAPPEQQQQQQQMSSAAADSSGTAPLSLAEKEALCDELMELVESLDHARDLHKIGGLPTLLQLMSSQHPSLRWRAAEVAATCMANNPPVQRWFMAGGALSHILDLLSDPNVKVQTKALLAVSALVRHYQPGLEAFRLAGGLQKVLGLLGCPADPDMAALSNEAAEAAADAAEDQQEPQRRKLQRKALALLQYMLLKHPADGIAAVQYGLADRLCAMLFAAGSDSDIRQAVLAVLLEVVRQPQGWQRLSRCEAGLVGHLQQLLQQHKQLSAEDQAAAAEEQVLLEQLLSLLQSHQAPMTSGTAPAALQDHIDLDPYLDGGERKEKPLSVRGTAQQQQQQQQQQSNDAVAASGAGMALMAVPKPDLR